MEYVRVALGSRSYTIYLEDGLLRDLRPVRAEFGIGQQLVVVGDETVAGLYAAGFQRSLERLGFRAPLIRIPPGEEQKSFATLQQVYDRLLEHACDRSSALIALGGGVVGDLVGFAAATFMRGVPYYQVPTTLLAQVDSSVGGKTAINHPQGKNLIGAFHQPRAVLIDPHVLETLPEREFRSGLAEVIKYGIIADLDLFRFLEEDLRRILAREPLPLVEIVRASCQIKAGVVAEDERDEGRRVILNFGHTFGHAIEAVTGYGSYSHGEAISVGMATAAHLSHRLGLCEFEAFQRVEALLKMAGLPVHIEGLDPGVVFDAMFYDKKTRGGVIRLVLMDAIGSVRLVEDVPPRLIRSCLSERVQRGPVAH